MSTPTDPIRICYRSSDGINIYGAPGGTLTAAQQEERFARIRWESASGRVAAEALEHGAGADGELDATAEGVMRGVFARAPTAGIRLYLAWIFFRMVRRPGSPEAHRIDSARAELRAEMERAILAPSAEELAKPRAQARAIDEGSAVIRYVEQTRRRATPGNGHTPRR